MTTGILDGKIWEIELLRTYTTNKTKCYTYGIIYSKTIINPLTDLYDDHWIETQVKASDVFRNNDNQLCFTSTKNNITHMTVVNGKIKTLNA